MSEDFVYWWHFFLDNAFLGSQLRPLSCREIFYATLMQSIVVACSIFGIVVSQFTAFVSIRVLGWMSGVSTNNFCRLGYSVRAFLTKYFNNSWNLFCPKGYARNSVTRLSEARWYTFELLRIYFLNLQKSRGFSYEKSEQTKESISTFLSVVYSQFEC